MSTRVEFKDGTERIFKDSNMWERNSRSGFYRIDKRVFDEKPKITHTSKLFSRKVVSRTEKRGYADTALAFIEISEVALVEEV